MHDLQHMSGSIFLVGLMGSGKTTIGRAVAKKLNMRFVDSDHEIESRTGTSIPFIFEVEGEESFRRREADVIRDLTALDNIVLATGGGAVLCPENRALLKSRGTVIYLRTGIMQLLQRTAKNKNRPLLQMVDPRKRMEEMSRLREPLYWEVANVVIETGRSNLQYLVRAIMSQIQVPSASIDGTAALALSSHFPNQQQNGNMNNSIDNSVAASINLQVDLGERSYPITIGRNLLSNVDLMAQRVAAKRVVIVTNTVVGPLYLETLTKTLQQAGKQVSNIVLPDGEEEKNWSSLMLIFDALLRDKCDRHSTLIALGGGVIGDLTGFAAASYMRGIPFVQVPTTLLAQVDSSVGGKTGINHRLGKNMIGAFYQPQAVIADTDTLQTLPPRELSAGLAEIIKYGPITDVAFFEWIEANIEKLRANDSAAIAYAIRRSCEIKASVVQQDEREGGLRAILNFGHTFGHAIESGLGYGQWLHGEAVGCGMVMAADLSQRLGYIDAATRERIAAVTATAGLPIVAPDLGEARWLELMQVDKKNEGGEIKFILIKPLGTPLITKAPQALLLETLKACSNTMG